MIASVGASGLSVLMHTGRWVRPWGLFEYAARAFLFIATLNGKMSLVFMILQGTSSILSTIDVVNGQ